MQAETLPVGHRRRFNAQLTLGQCLLGQRRFQEAEPLLIETRGPEHAVTATARGSLVTLYKAWGRREEAARYRSRSPSSAAAPSSG